MTRNVRLALIGAAVVIVAVLLGAYFGGPYLATKGLMDAAKAGDRDGVEARVDFPSVREHLKADVSSMMLAKMSSDPAMRDNPFAGIGAALAPMITDRLIDSYVTPEGLTRILSRSPDRAPLATATTTAPSSGTKPVVTMGYAGSLDRFRVAVTSASDSSATITLVLQRNGLFDWRLMRIELPKDAFNPPAQAQAPPPSDQDIAMAPAADSATALVAGMGMSPEVQAIIAREEAENETCRGGSGDDPTTMAACQRRDTDVALLKSKGFCWGEGAANEAQATWSKCLAAPRVN